MTHSGDLIGRAKSTLEIVLALASILYALGYATWALYAWEYQLGIPPALEAQYLVAGFGPAVILLLVYGILRLLRYLSGWIRIKRSTINPKLPRTLDSSGTLLVISGGALLLLGKEVLGWVLIVIGGVIYGSGAFFSERPVDRFFAKQFTWYAYSTAVLLGLITILLYSTRIFPGIRPELGGPRPQCVTLDLDPDTFSQETIEKLAASRVTEDGKHVRTIPIWLLLQGPQYVFAAPEANPNAIRGRAFRISETKLSAIFPSSGCGLP